MSLSEPDGRRLLGSKISLDSEDNSFIAGFMHLKLRREAMMITGRWEKARGTSDSRTVNKIVCLLGGPTSEIPKLT